MRRASARGQRAPRGNAAVRHATFQQDLELGVLQPSSPWELETEHANIQWQNATQDYLLQDDPWLVDEQPAQEMFFITPQQDEQYAPQQAAPVPQYQQPVYLDQNEPSLQALSQPQRKPGVALPLLVMLASLSILLACALSVYKAYQPQEGFARKLRMMQGNAYFPGIYIDGIAVGGQQPQAIRATSAQAGAGNDPALNIRLRIDEVEYQFNNQNIPYSKNLEDVMEEAWSIGRQGSLALVNSFYTPFETRWQHVRHTQQNGAYFHTEVSYDRGEILSMAQSIAAQINREPINAVVSSFDFSTKKFSVTQDVKGRLIAPETIAQTLIQALDQRDYNASLTLATTTLLPRVSSVDLNNRFTILSHFQTKTTSDQDRNNNIALAAQAINNRTLMPGETFSFNETTGQRTLDKGYRGAPAIQGGVLIDDVGGGVCQVSSTLFYAAAASGMNIVERSPHAWPVSYMDKGLDATVNWPNLDFKFKNDKDTPVFIIASYENRKLTIEVYGMQNEPGESIRLETELIATMQPPREPMMQQNLSLPFGTQKELKQARTGYVVDTYRVYLRNGSELRREKLFSSRYKEIQQVIEYN